MPATKSTAKNYRQNPFDKLMKFSLQHLYKNVNAIAKIFDANDSCQRFAGTRISLVQKRQTGIAR